MTNLIDDETASRYWQERDTAPEAERESRNAALMEWATAKKAEQRRTQRDEVESGYMDFEGWWGTTGADAAMFNGDEDRQEILNRRYIAHQFDQTPDEQGQYYPTYRDQFLQQTFGKSGLSEAETFNLIKGAVESKKATEGAINNIPGDVAMALWDNIGTGAPVNPAKVLETWKQKNADQLAGLPENWESKTLAEVGKYISDTEQMLRDHAEPLKKVYDHFAAVTGRGVENAGESQPKNLEEMQALVDTLAGMPQPVRDRALASVYMAAENSGMDAKSVLQQFGESWSRTLNRVRTTALVAEEYDTTQRLKMLRDTEGLAELYKNKTDQGPKVVTGATAAFSPQDYEPLAPDERTAFAAEAEKELARFQVYRELQNIADNKFDPIQKIKGNATPDFVEAILYGTPDALATSAMAAIPVVGLPLTVGTIYADEYNQLRLQGIDAENAQGIAAYSAGLQTVPEVLGAKLIFGQLPWFENLLRKYANPARFGRGSQFAMRYAAGIAGENLTEGIQDLATPVVQDIFAAFRSEVPDVDWDTTWKDWRNARPDVFAATLVPVMVGTGMASMADSDRFSSYEYRLSELYKPLGLSEEKIKLIEDGGTPQEMQTRLVEQVTSISSEEIKSGIAYQEQRLNEAKAEQEDVTKPTLVRETAPDGSQQFVVRDGSGQAVYTSKDYTAASQALIETRREQVAADLEGTRTIIRDRVNHWLSQNPANTLIEETQGLNAQQKLEQLQAAGNVAQIEELHNRITNSPFKDTPYDQINILGEASVQDVAEMVWRPLIKINPNTRPENLREEIHHIGVKIALKNNRVTLDTLRGWLEATESALPGTFQNLVRETEGDIIESLAQVQAAYEDGKINANEETQLPASFIDYIKNMMRAFAEVLRRAVALRGAFKDGSLPAEYESFLAESVGLNQQTLLDTTRDRVSNEVLTDTNYSIGSKPYPMENKGKWYSNEDFAKRGGRLVTMSPDQFLSQVRPLEVDDASRDNIDDLKNIMQSGRKLDPLTIYADGKEDGRHRAIAAKELGMDTIPVIDFRQPVSIDTSVTNYSIGFAPNGKPSNLTTEEQALARSPEFKARVGDWEALAKQKVLELLPQHTPSIDFPKNLKGKELKNVVKPFYEKQKTTGFILPDGIKINITNRGWKEIIIHGADSRVLHIAANLQELLSRSLHLWSENNTDNKYPNVKNFHNYGTRATLNGIDSYIRFVIREDTNGQIHYDHDATSVEVFSANKNGEEGSQPTRNPNPGEDLASLAKNRLYQWWNSVNPESVTVKTDENGEPLASEIARFRQETGTSNYSIASQSEIDRVNKALGGMNRGPDARIAVYERAKAKFSTLLQNNQQALDNLRAGTVSFRRTQLLQALGELDAILSIFPPDIRGRVGGYTRLASIAPHDVFKDGEKVSEVSGMNGAIISAWMREGLSIGPAGQQTELPPGYTAKENLGTARADRAIADFFKKRIEMIDRELEKTLRREYDEAFRKLLDRTKPKKAKPGEKPKGIGGDIQDLFSVVRDSVDMNATQVAAHIAGLDSMIASGDLTAEQEARAMVEAALVALTGDWKNADADRRRTAFMEASRIWNGAYAAHAQKIIRQREEREIARAEAIVATGKAGELAGRKSKAIADSGLKGSWKDYILNLLNFDQVVGVLFGENTEVANTIIDKQRRAENAKEDGSQAKMQELEDFFTGLAGGNVLNGERLRYRLTQPSMTVKGIEMSELEALSAVMMWVQEDGRRHMEGEMDEAGRPVGKWHYNQDFVDEILANLSEEALALRSWLTRNYANEYAKINDVYSELNGVNLPQIQLYSPVTVQPVNAPTGQVLDPVSGSAMSGASTSPGALRTRGTAIAEPRFQDVLQTYISHTLQMEHWKAFAPMIAEANGILRNRDVQNSVEEKGGAEARKMLNAWLDYFAQGGTRDAGAHLALNQGLNNVLGRASQVALVGRASTLLIQSTQLGAALAEMPVKAYLKRMGKLLTGQLGWDAALNSDYIQRRVKQMPPVVQLAMQGLKGARPTAIQQAGKRLGMLLSGADGLFTAGTYAITYDYHLTKAKELGLAGQEAEDYARNTAERVTDRIAQPTRAGARSLYENTSTNPLARAGWAFASEARKNLALVAYSFAERDTATKMRTLAYVVALNAIGSAILRSIWRDILDDEDDELFDDKYWSPKRIATAIATEPLYGFPVLGSVVQEAVYKSFGEYKPSESLFSVQNAIGPIKRLPDHLSGDTDLREVMRDIDMVVSALGIMHPNIAAAASITHLAKDLFNLTDSTVDAVTEN